MQILAGGWSVSAQDRLHAVLDRSRAEGTSCPAVRLPHGNGTEPDPAGRPAPRLLPTARLPPSAKTERCLRHRGRLQDTAVSESPGGLVWAAAGTVAHWSLSLDVPGLHADGWPSTPRTELCPGCRLTVGGRVPYELLPDCKRLLSSPLLSLTWGPRPGASPHRIPGLHSSKKPVCAQLPLNEHGLPETQRGSSQAFWLTLSSR